MAPRGRKPKVKNEQESTVFEKNRYIILPDALTNDKTADRQLIKLRHPQTSELAIFVYSENDKTLAQMRSLPFSHRSFFKGNKVIPIDRIDFVTLVDPLFLFLPYFIKCSSMFCPLDQILVDEHLPELNNLLMKLSELANLKQIATKKEVGDLILWQYNENNTLEWLTPKINKVAKVLITQQINVNQNAAISSSFKLSETSINSTDEQYKRYAYDIISEYLHIDIQKSLLKHLGLPEIVECNKRKADENSDVNKRTKFIKVDYEEMPHKVEKTITPKLTAKDKALKKAATGTKSISSFFKKSI
ncbi:ribonuclease H2 subunit B [Rhopalosiphum maidis]|uniref:ribonuclease H2 subunit B n=1 Tax=Rhopalosiphum maidis TaxID=43146 RepID=UPI000EFDD343|nr:ribonuclease H2 subunit B [Rhopalosiphum maidis]